MDPLIDPPAPTRPRGGGHMHSASHDRHDRHHPGPRRVHDRVVPDPLVRDRATPSGSRSVYFVARPRGPLPRRRRGRLVGNGMIVVAVAALIGGRLYHVIDQWQLYEADPITALLPIVRPARRLVRVLRVHRPRRAGRDHHRHDRGLAPDPPLEARRSGVWADIVAPRRCSSCRRSAGWGNFFNQELYGPPTNLPWGIAIDCAHRVARRTRAPRSRSAATSLPAAVPVRVAVRACSARSRCSGSARRCRTGCVPGDLLADLLHLVRLDAVRPRVPPDRDNWTFFGIPTAQLVTLGFILVGWSGSSGTATVRPAEAGSTIGRSRPRRASTRRTRSDDDDRWTRDRDARRAPTPAAGTSPGATHEARRPRRPDVGRRAATASPAPAPAALGRLSPQALADARGGAVEGLDWLGRTPGVEGVAHCTGPCGCWPGSVLVRGVPVPDRDVRPGAPAGRRLPARRRRPIAAGWTRSSSSTRCPLEPRAWFLGSAPSTFTSRWRERLHPPVGGLLPGLARRGRRRSRTSRRRGRSIANGGVFAQMPEGTV